VLDVVFQHPEVSGIFKRFVRLLGVGGPAPARTLDGFVDNLLQTFENCRAGLADGTLASDPEAVQSFFQDLYQKEVPRLREAIALQDPTQPAPAREALFAKVDELLRKVVIPAYARTVAPFTLRERNDFYLTRDPWHGLERLGWGAAGMVLGGFVVWAPFIPLYAKEWVLVFALGGLLFPNLRRFFALRRFEGELNRMVARADDEIWRISFAAMTRGTLLQATTDADLVPSADEAGVSAEGAAPSRAESADRPSVERSAPAKTKVGQGGR
jgi:hypothetical protein